MSPRRPLPAVVAVVAALALLAAGWALRATYHPAPHSGGDNAGYVALADALVRGEGYTESWDPATPPHTKYPPVFPAALAAAIALGARSWAALKVVPLLFGVAALGGVVAWGWRRRGPPWGVGAALATAWSAAFLGHVHHLLSDVPLLAFTMLALALVERRRDDRLPEGTPPATEDEPEGPGARPGVPGVGAVVLALVFAGLAWFTRSAALPLLLALGAWLLVTRAWKLALGAAVALGLPTLWWLARARGAVSDGAYAREFWMVDPYRPELGEIGPAGLVPRAFENGVGYLVDHLPAALAGASPGAGSLGLLLGLLAVAGWARAALHRPGAAEFFVPLYLGVILVWPVVWSGDRFLLPLLPIAFVHAAEAVAAGVARLRAEAVPPVLAAAAAALLIVQGGGVAGVARHAADCRAVVRAAGPWACSGVGMVQFTEAARWAGRALPEGAVTLTRKPRIWYAMGGGQTRTYPFLADPDTLLAAAARAGASYLVLDAVASQARLVAAAIVARPSAFCTVASFGGEGGAPRTELLGILPQGSTPPPAGMGDTVVLEACPPGFRGEGAALEPYRSSMPIPILDDSSSP